MSRANAATTPLWPSMDMSNETFGEMRERDYEAALAELTVRTRFFQYKTVATSNQVRELRDLYTEMAQSTYVEPEEEVDQNVPQEVDQDLP